MTDQNDGSLDYVYHATVKKVSEDFDTLNFNTAISQMMIFINECYKTEKVYKEYALGFIKMLSCIAPHVGEEMWSILCDKEGIAFESWPTYDESKLVKNEVEFIIQVNGKVRARINVAMDTGEEELQKKAFECEAVKNFTEGKTIRKVIAIKNKLVNIVAN